MTLIAGRVGAAPLPPSFRPAGAERSSAASWGVDNPTNWMQNYKFTGMERDTETSNDHTWFRNYEHNLGRWLSPDPVGGGANNPQSWNRYAYVENGPMSFTDPTGLNKFNIIPSDNLPLILYSGIYQDCMWNGGCSGLERAPSGSSNALVDYGGHDPGVYVDGVQQTTFNTIHLGTNMLTIGYQATVTSSNGSTKPYYLWPDPLLGQITSSALNNFESSFPVGAPPPGSSTSTITSVSFSWVVAPYPTKAWFPTTQYSYTPSPFTGGIGSQ